MHTLPRRNFLQTALLAGSGAAVLPPPELRADASSRPQLDILTLGTGAADHDWNHFGAPGVRGSTSTLLDGHILIDCGKTGSANLARFHIPPRALTDILFTHSHGDHFDTDEIRKVLDRRDPGQPPPAVWASPNVLAALTRRLPGRFTGHPLKPGTAFDIGQLHVTALPANHLIVADPTEQALHFLIETPSGTLLYALDGAWMLKQARQLIGKKHLDMIIWDATMSKTGDFRIFEHNDLAMIGLMVESLKTTGAVDAKTVCVLDHVARTLWPRDLKEAEKLAADRGWTLAADGRMLHLP